MSAHQQDKMLELLPSQDIPEVQIVCVSQTNSSLDSLEADPAFIKKLVKASSQGWQKNEENVPSHLNTLRYEFMTECYEIILKRVVDESRLKLQVERRSQPVLEMLEGINRMFMERQSQIQKEEGVAIHQFKFCWLTLANQLWNEFLSKRYPLTDAIIGREVAKVQKQIQILLILRRDSSVESSPVFSQDSFNPKAYQAKMNNKYQWFRLEELLSEEQVDKMRARIEMIKNSNLREALIKDLDSHFSFEELNVPWSDED